MPSGLAAPDHTVPAGRFFWQTLPGHFVPGYDRCCPYGTKYILRAGVLIELAAYGLKPRAALSWPLRTTDWETSKLQEGDQCELLGEQEHAVAKSCAPIGWRTFECAVRPNG
jgi:hypothetical protein